MGTLHVVATPIGNLEDMTPRAQRVLSDVALIAAEDTRRTGALLRHFGISTPMVSYHAHNERRRRARLLAALNEGDVALVTDAGTPGISDPGNDLVAAAHAAGYPVSPVPGASSLAAAVSASGLVPGPFVTIGFLPRETAARRLVIARVAATGMPFVVYEAPSRVAATLGELWDALGPRPAVVLRELTKLHEEVRPGSLADLSVWATADEPRGEVVVVVAGAEDEPAAAIGDDIPALVGTLRRSGLTASAAAREAAAITGRPRSELYEMARAWHSTVPTSNAEHAERERP
ncbi:MAG: 16S rRNA (cytidine(1402)-2'-O)-methyltransferase [uncultured Thermomicrobiales bacterium]|uniref:Ribosomal RNA small subunit methyltransferase I n=1 Tax=uncultured Thermomicrobiales bacterium TaxID=1645740 RepID=A0A6J4V8C8_9BACT|nr:MAG: 16S rRNA (cytidine(1402)-2'-O)-methyltransferase [uncultured Thermomicrobiales bacterium]